MIISTIIQLKVRQKRKNTLDTNHCDCISKKVFVIIPHTVKQSRNNAVVKFDAFNIERMDLNKIASISPAAKCIGSALTELSQRPRCGEMVISVYFARTVVSIQDIMAGITCGTSAMQRATIQMVAMQRQTLLYLSVFLLIRVRN